MGDIINKSEELKALVDDMDKAFDEFSGETLRKSQTDADLDLEIEDLLSKAKDEDEDDEDEDEDEDDEDEDEDEDEEEYGKSIELDVEEDEEEFRKSLITAMDASFNKLEKSFSKKSSIQEKRFVRIIETQNKLIKSLAEQVERIGNTAMPIKATAYMEKSFAYIDGEKKEFKTTDLKKALDDKITKEKGADQTMVSRIEVKLNRGELLNKSELQFLGIDKEEK